MKTARPRGFLSPYKKDQISLKLKSEQKIDCVTAHIRAFLQRNALADNCPRAHLA